MATYNFYEPQRAGIASLPSPIELGYYAAQGATFKRGDFLQLITTGTITNANPNGSISTSVGPTSVQVNLISTSTSVVTGPVTISAATSAGAPAITYYVFLTYQGAANIEGVPGQEFIINCNAGLVPTITVTNVGSPANSTGTGVYVGLFPGGEVQQAVTAFASTTTLTYPLANNIGVNRSVTNPSTNIVGFALNSSLALMFTGTGGSFNVNEAGQFGSTMNLAPLTPTEQLLNYVDKLQGFYCFEISLKQPWFPSLQGTTFGLTLDAATGIWVADTSAGNKICTILQPASGVNVQPFGQPVPVVGGNPGDIGLRVIGYVSTASALV